MVADLAVSLDCSCLKPNQTVPDVKQGTSKEKENNSLQGNDLYYLINLHVVLILSQSHADLVI